MQHYYLVQVNLKTLGPGKPLVLFEFLFFFLGGGGRVGHIARMNESLLYNVPLS